MKKKALISLPIAKERNDIPAMQCVEEITNKTTYGDYKYNKYNYRYDAFIDCTTGEDVLIVDVFTPAPQSEFKYRLFQTDKKWFSIDNTGKTSERSLFLGLGTYYDNCIYHPFNNKTDSIINEYINKKNKRSYFINDKGVKQIKNLQDTIRKERLQQKYNKIKESASIEMLNIRSVPKDFEKWITNTAMAKSRYLFYDAGKKKKTIARCSHCGEMVIVDTPKRDTKIICPCCNSLCIAKPYKAWCNSSGFKDTASVKYLQPLKNGSFCIRNFYVSWSFTNSTKPWKLLNETNRVFVNIEYGQLNIISYYQNEPGHQGGDWRKYFNHNECDTVGYIYPSTLNKIFKSQADFKKYHIDFNKIAKLCNPISVVGLFRSVNEVEFLSNLVNNNLSKMAQSVINCYSSRGNKSWLFSINGFDITKGALRKGCGISKEELPILKRLNPNIEEFELYRACKRLNKFTDEATMKELFRIRVLTGAPLDKLIRILRYCSINKFVKYFAHLEKTYFKTKKYKNSWQNPYYYFINDYLDYIDSAILLEYNLKKHNVLFPNNFENAHDTLYKIVNDKSFKNAELPQIARQFNEYDELYSYSYKDLLIRPPKSHNELKYEGEKLDHCVASYAKRVATGETIILFIRKASEPDVPYFTLNLDPNTFEIIQNRGYHNAPYPQSVKTFTDKWYKNKIESIKRRSKKCKKITVA